MNVVDSSGWLEFFASGPNVDFFRGPIRNISELIVPAISLYEVYKRLLQQTDKENALRALSIMKMGKVIDLNASLALDAAEISIDFKIPMADSIILATARQYNATLWTQDSDFQGELRVFIILAKSKRRVRPLPLLSESEKEYNEFEKQTTNRLNMLLV